MSFFWSEIRPGVKQQGGSNPHQQSPGAPPPPLPPPRDFLQVVNNANNGQGLHTRATREKRADQKRNDFNTQVSAVTTPPTPLSLPSSFSFLALLTTYFNEFTTVYLSQSNT